MAQLLVDVLAENRRKGRFLLHEFVIMPNHSHLLLTPAAEIPLEKALQFIKGGFSYRAKREINFPLEIWQASFVNHRIRDGEDYKHHHTYIWENPVRAGLSERPELFAWSSASLRGELDAPPPGLNRLRKNSACKLSKVFPARYFCFTVKVDSKKACAAKTRSNRRCSAM